MRITDSISYRNLLDNISLLNERLAKASDQVSSGKKLLQLHDGPADSAEMVDLNGQLAQIDQYQTNADSANFYLQVSESSLNSLYDLVTAVYTRGSAAANNFNDANARTAYTAEIRSQLDQILTLSNTQVRGRSIFAGTLVTAPAFTMNGDTATYQGNDVVNTIDISDGLQVHQNIPGAAVFSPVFASVDALLAAIDSGDLAAVQTALGQFSTTLGAVNQVRSRLGVDLAKIQDAAVARQGQQADIQSRQARIGNADMAAAITQLNQLQSALNATFSVGSVLGQKNLFDYLG